MAVLWVTIEPPSNAVSEFNTKLPKCCLQVVNVIIFIVGIFAEWWCVPLYIEELGILM